MNPRARLDYSHLHALTGPYGTFEHAQFASPRVKHGYCTDDVARVLLVASREPHPDADLIWLARSSLDFLAAAQGRDGRFRNRRRASGSWSGPHTTEDCWGRALWALGTAAARSPEADLREEALWHFERGARQRSAWPRATAFAVLGASEVLAADPDHAVARSLQVDAVRVLDRPVVSASWNWPEGRLAYANAVLPEAMMTLGADLGDGSLVSRGASQLAWLLARETRDGHLSVTPAAGAAAGSALELFDQQPIEVAAMSDACLRAAALTGDAAWRDGHELAVAWFEGANDAGAVMYDAATGGGYDGLTAAGANLNQGAESTLALLSTMQNARRFAKSAA